MTPRLVVLMIGLACASGIAAQDLNTRQLAPTHTRVLSCGQVDMAWNVELITQYPRIPEACFEVVTNNIIEWARFEADVVRLDRDGSVVADFCGPSGAKMGRYTVRNNPGDQVTLDGRKYPFSALRSGQRGGCWHGHDSPHALRLPRRTNDARLRVRVNDDATAGEDARRGHMGSTARLASRQSVCHSDAENGLPA